MSPFPHAAPITVAVLAAAPALLVSAIEHPERADSRHDTPEAISAFWDKVHHTSR